MTPQEKKQRGIKLENKELLNEYFKNNNDVQRIAKEKPTELRNLWYSHRTKSMNNTEKIKWIKREITKLTGEQIKKNYFRLGNFTIKQMEPRNLKILWYRGPDDETPDQKVLRIRTQVASDEIKKEKKEKLKEYQGVYFDELYYKDLLVLSQLPHFWWRPLTDELKKNIKSSENNAKMRHNQRYYSPKRQKINTSVEMNTHSSQRIEHLRIQMNTLIFKNLKSVDLFKIFSELELIKKLETVNLMDHKTLEKYDKFLHHVAGYRYFIEQQHAHQLQGN